MECVFDPSCFRNSVARYAGHFGVQNYSYPPHALLVAVPFSMLPYYAALALWTALGALFFIMATRKWQTGGMSPYLAVLTPAAAINIWNGHYGFLLGGLWLLFFFYSRQRWLLAGAVAALLTFKPHMGLLVFAKSLTRPKAFLIAVAGTILLILLSTAIFGVNSWTGFLTGTTAYQASILNDAQGRFYERMMPSAYVALGEGTIGIAAQCAFTAAAIGILVIHRRLDAFTAATATFLIVPYAFNYDMTVACLGFVILLFSRWSTLNLVQRSALSLAFLVPELSFVPILRLLCPPVLLVALLLQSRLPPISPVGPEH